MTYFFEVDEKKKTIKLLNLDDFSNEDLEIYMTELKHEMERVKEEVKKKVNSKIAAEKFFK